LLKFDHTQKRKNEDRKNGSNRMPRWQTVIVMTHWTVFRG